MSTTQPRLVIACLVYVCCFGANHASAQILHLRSPQHTLRNGFHEHFGAQLAMQQMGPRGGFYFHSGAPAFPPFGGYSPANDAQMRFRNRTGNVSWSLGISASQGSSQQYGVQAPYLVVPNGGYGYFGYGTWTPFVTGWIPIVGAGGASPVRERLRRLQEEQLLNLERSTAVGEKTGEINEKQGDQPLPPALPAVRRTRQPDDPPLVLKPAS